MIPMECRAQLFVLFQRLYPPKKIHKQKKGNRGEQVGMLLQIFMNREEMKPQKGVDYFKQHWWPNEENYLHNFCSQVPSVLGQSLPKIVANLQSIKCSFCVVQDPSNLSNLKLQIPKPLSDHLQNDLPANSGNTTKNKNDVLGKAKLGEKFKVNQCAMRLRETSLLGWYKWGPFRKLWIWDIQ